MSFKTELKSVFFHLYYFLYLYICTDKYILFFSSYYTIILFLNCQIIMINKSFNFIFIFVSLYFLIYCLYLFVVVYFHIFLKKV